MTVPTLPLFVHGRHSMQAILGITDTDQHVIVEIKDQVTDAADIKANAAMRWTETVDRRGTNGQWSPLA